METKCGYVALVGRPNVGKSTLMNRLVGQKISITSKKPQTTRHQILALESLKDTQIIYLDTPGIHKRYNKALNQYMNKAAHNALKDADLIVFIVEALRWTDEDEVVLEQLSQTKLPVILAVNKVDKHKDKSLLLPYIEELSKRHSFESVMPLSAKHGKQVDTLRENLIPYMPKGPFLFDSEQITNRPVRFLVAEIVREKIYRLCGQELPYAVTVDIEKFHYERPDLCRICVLILVEKTNHKRMVVGKAGEKLKQIGQSARSDIEKLIETKVFLELWCKVKSGWADNEKLLASLGYDDN